MKKDIYIYPAVFSYDEDGITIEFPDLPGCVSCGDNEEDALYMAKDALRNWLLAAEDLGLNIPEASKLNAVKVSDGQAALLIEVCLSAYREPYKDKAVKKTLTIPRWLNDIATKENINFSSILQNALIERLNIKK